MASWVVTLALLDFYHTTTYLQLFPQLLIFVVAHVAGTEFLCNLLRTEYLVPRGPGSRESKMGVKISADE